MKRKIKRSIAASLSGFKERQEQRNAARNLNKIQARLYRARRMGWLDSWDDVQAILNETNLPVEVQHKYRLKLVSCAGVQLVYLPNGILNYRRQVKLDKPEPPPTLF